MLTQFQELYSRLESCLAFNDVISRQDIQGIVINIPAENHLTLVGEALLVDKYLYVGKPLVSTR